MRIITRKNRIIQPQGLTGITTRFRKDIVFACLSGINGRYDLISNTPPTVAGTVDNTVSEHGLASYPVAKTSGLKWTALRPIDNANNGYTILTVAKPIAEATVGRMVIIGNEASSAFNQVGLAFNATRENAASSGTLAHWEYSSTWRARSQATGVIDGNWHVFVVARRAGDWPSTLYVDGINVTSASNNGVGVAMTSGVELHQSPLSTSNGANCPSLLTVVFNRELSEVEVRDISQRISSVWQFFDPQKRTINFDLGAPPVVQAVKVWNGTAHVPAVSKVWNGSSFVEKPLKTWSGTEWITA